MADVASTLRAWSTTTSSNSPSGTTTIGSGLAPNLQQIQATVRQYLASKGSDMASGSTVNLATADGYFIDITGTTTITSLGTEVAGISYLLRFNGALTLTHNGTSLIIPGAANITTASGDLCQVTSLGSGNWVVDWFSPSETTPVGKIPTTKGDILAATAARTLARVAVGTNGQVLTADSSVAAGVKWATPSGITLGTESTTTGGTAIDFAIPSGAKRVVVMGVGCSTNGTSPFMVQLGDAGGIENAGYSGGVMVTGGGGTPTANSSGFLLFDTLTAANAYDFRLVLDLENAAAFRWVASGSCIDTGATQAMRASLGTKATSQELTTVRVTTAGGANTFDATILNVAYE